LCCYISLNLLCLRSLSTLFHLYCGSQSNQWRKPHYPKEKQMTCRMSLTIFITLSCIEYTSPWAGFEVISLYTLNTINGVMIGQIKGNVRWLWNEKQPAKFCNISLIFGSIRNVTWKTVPLILNSTPCLNLPHCRYCLYNLSWIYKRYITAQLFNQYSSRNDTIKGNVRWLWNEKQPAKFCNISLIFEIQRCNNWSWLAVKSVSFLDEYWLNNCRCEFEPANVEVYSIQHYVIKFVSA
jgi:hypothetical protein